jgi:hypothetical protein
MNKTREAEMSFVANKILIFLERRTHRSNEEENQRISARISAQHRTGANVSFKAKGAHPISMTTGAEKQ